ncbi:hypothetical protein PENSPDRAFT_647919 [Peniophora sp. CONT]|nr:hypothetical protein PENSPDRAFT_647919 [Peniophora sp. CONT]
MPGHTTIPGISVEVLPLRDLLKPALQMRASGGSRIHALTMQSCFTESESWMQPCSEYVRIVDWKNACTKEDAEIWEESEEEFDFEF